MTASYEYADLKQLFTKNMTRDGMRKCARNLGLNPVGLKKSEIDELVANHLLRWRLKVPEEATVMQRKTRGRPKKTKIHIQTQT